MLNEDKVEEYLRNHSIEFVTRGPDVGKNNINIKCPFCGDNDEGHHMGINVDKNVYSCWRSNNHKGRDVSYLLRYLTSESLLSIRRFIGMSLVLEENDCQSMLKTLSENDTAIKEERKIGGVRILKYPNSFRPLWEKHYRDWDFIDYLSSRGFYKPRELAHSYELHFSLSGDFANRIVFPIYYKNKLVSWIGRTIDKYETKHYRDLSIQESVIHPKFCIANYDNVKLGGDTLYIVEGFMDFLKLDYYLAYEGDRATCLFTNSMTEEQKLLLWKVGKKYSKIIVLMDNDALSNSIDIVDQLKPILNNVYIGTVLTEYKDPGELPVPLIQKNKFLYRVQQQ
jgi:hypothetical protein